MAGCVSVPQTAEEFRRVVDGSSFAKVEVFEVQRPARDIMATFQQRAPECLDVTVHAVSHPINDHSSVIEYRSRVLPGTDHSELHLQQLHKTNVIHLGTPPEGGAFVVVVDVHATSADRARLQIHGPAVGFEGIYRAVRGWATGKDLRCPDLTRPYR